MAQGKDDVRRQLEKTRESIGRTVEALAEKANPRPRSRRRTASGSRRSPGRRRSSSSDEGLSWGYAAAGFAGGVLLGTLLPRSETEDEAVGPLADELKRPAKRTARKAKRRGAQTARRGRQAVRRGSKTATRAAKSTASRAGKATKTATRKAKRATSRRSSS